MHHYPSPEALRLLRVPHTLRNRAEQRRILLYAAALRPVQHLSLQSRRQRERTTPRLENRRPIIAASDEANARRDALHEKSEPAPLAGGRERVVQRRADARALASSKAELRTKPRYPHLQSPSFISRESRRAARHRGGGRWLSATIVPAHELRPISIFAAARQAVRHASASPPEDEPTHNLIIYITPGNYSQHADAWRTASTAAAYRIGAQLVGLEAMVALQPARHRRGSAPGDSPER